MEWINTVTGRVRADDLGATLVHEHLLIGARRTGPSHPGRALAEQIAAFMPNWEPTHLFKRILPQLRERGVSEQHVHTMLVENPRRYFIGDVSPR